MDWLASDEHYCFIALIVSSTFLVYWWTLSSLQPQSLESPLQTRKTQSLEFTTSSDRIGTHFESFRRFSATKKEFFQKRISSDQDRHYCFDQVWTELFLNKIIFKKSIIIDKQSAISSNMGQKSVYEEMLLSGMNINWKKTFSLKNQKTYLVSHRHCKLHPMSSWLCENGFLNGNIENPVDKIY